MKRCGGRHGRAPGFILAVAVALLAPLLLSSCEDTGHSDKGHPYRLFYYLDTGKSLPFEQILELNADRWTPTPAKAPGFGFQDAVLWLKVEGSEGAPTATVSADILDISYSQLDSVQVFYLDASGGLVEKKTGDTLTFYSRDVPANSFAFSVSGSRGPIYVRIRTQGTLMAPLGLFSDTEWNRAIQIRTALYGLYFGGLVFIGLYNLFLFFSIRDRTYLYYSIYVGFVFVSFLSFLGYGHQYLWPGSDFWNNRSFVVSAMLYVIASLQFAVRYLAVFLNHPWLGRSMRFLQILFLPVILIAILGDYQLATRLGSSLNIVSSLLIFVTAIVRTMDGFRPARPFLVAWFFFLSGQIIGSVAFLGLFPDVSGVLPLPFIGSALELTLLSLALGDRFKHQQELAVKDRLELTDSYSRFVPREFLSFLKRRSIKDVHLGDSVEARMTVLFADIQSFTTLSESMTAEENFRFINALLKRIGPVIRKHDGFIDKYIGDAIMALFPKRPDDALEAIMEMQGLLEDYNRARIEKGLERIQIGVGVHTGMVMLGTIGENERMEGTVIGDTVNTASRLEGLTRNYNVTVIVSKECRDLLEDGNRYRFRFIEAVQVKGKSKHVDVLEFMGLDSV